MNADCFVTMGGDGFYSRVDPKDPNTIYANMQNGGMVRFDKRTGERVSAFSRSRRRAIRPLRWNWDAPLIDQPALEYAPLLRRAAASTAATTAAIAGARSVRDLTRKLDRNKLPADGQDLAHRRHPEERLHGALRQHLVHRRIAQAGGPDLRRHRRRPGAGHRGRRQELAQDRQARGRSRGRLRAAHPGLAARRRHGLRGLRESPERRLQTLPDQEHR